MINEWFMKQKYIKGKAIILDANGLKTSNHLIKSNSFNAMDIIIPEYDTEIYEINKEDLIFGESMINGEYLEILKEIKPEEISLIYADYTGSYEKYVKPLFEYMEHIKYKLRNGVIIAITWSNNGAGSNNIRNKITRKFGKYQALIGMKEIKGSPTDIGYGDGGCMNVIFYEKIPIKDKSKHKIMIK